MIEELSKKIVEKREILNGVEKRVDRGGTLKPMRDRRIGESILPIRRLDKMKTLLVCLRSIWLARPNSQ